MSSHVVILGAGISGLASAWFLKQQLGSNVRLTLLESAPRVGGWVHTQRGEFLFEQGPRGSRPQGAGLATLRLVEALGLQDQVILSNPLSKFRYLYTGQKLHQIPNHPWQFLTSPLRKGVFSALWRDWRAPKGSKKDETIYDFIERRLGKEIAERWVDPIISGIYAGDIRKLSVKACFPRLVECEQKSGGLLKAFLKRSSKKEPCSTFAKKVQSAPLFSFKGGMQTLVDALADRVEAEIHLNSRPIALEVEPEGIQVKCENGISLQADDVISTLPAYALGSLLSDSSLCLLLNQLTYATVAVVNLGYKKRVLGVNGFGYLIPRQEQEEILGCVWDSCLFPQQNRSEEETRLTVMLGGVHHPYVAGLSSKECLAMALEGVSRHLKIEAEPSEWSVKMAKRAIPQYEVGYLDLLSQLREKIQKVIPRLILAGSGFTGVAVNDCIAHAEKIWER